jgi:predicted glycogen debranching enzyme
MIQFDQTICSNLQEASSREWLETNGLGGFASSTISGINTRRYHGLLFAATKPPVGRLLMLSKLEETLVIDGHRYDLSANQYPGVIHPEGFRFLRGFRLDPFPVFTYEVEGLHLEKSIFMLHGENTTVIQYMLRPAKSGVACAIEIRPLIAFRDYHSMAHENTEFDVRFRAERGLVTMMPYFDEPTLYLAHDAVEVTSLGDWYRNFEYEREKERGFNGTEDLLNPCVLVFDLGKRNRASLVASTERRDAGRAKEYENREVERRRSVVAPSRYNDALVYSLISASDQFVVARGKQKSVIAGYPWFGDWGRDTMIALPGLTLLTGRIDVAQSILSEFARHVDQGMLPNRFPDSGETPEYNTVDATLWFFEAIRALTQYSKDYTFVQKQLYPTLKDIIDWHVMGTRYNIKVDDDGLLFAGEEGVQLTWMDAKVGNWVVTPRTGKPVEIQALWYNALNIMSDLATRFGDTDSAMKYTEMAEHARHSFNEQFWNEEAGCLYDVINGDTRDGAIRPNQIFAISLEHSLLDHSRARSVVEVVQRELLTPFGLRSLSPSDPQYIGRYAGSPLERDGAYHQGTVWAWLIGPFLTAYVRINEGSREAREQAGAWLEPFRAHLSQAGLGQISEVFDGDAPHNPGGCIAQAWSVAEVLRSTLEEAQNFGHRTWHTKPLQAAYRRSV